MQRSFQILWRQNCWLKSSGNISEISLSWLLKVSMWNNCTAFAARWALSRWLPQRRASHPLQLCCSDKEWHHEVSEPGRVCWALSSVWGTARKGRGLKFICPPRSTLQCIVHWAIHQHLSRSWPTCFHWSSLGACVLYAVLRDRSTAQRPCGLPSLLTWPRLIHPSSAVKSAKGGGNRRDVKTVTAST